MRAQALLEELRGRGVTLEARGDRLRFKPVNAVPPEMLAKLRARKQEILAELTQDRESIEPEAQLPEAGPPGAVLVASPRYGEVWIALDDSVATSLRDEEQHRETPRPVLTPEDLEYLLGRSERAIHVALDLRAVFPVGRFGNE